MIPPLQSLVKYDNAVLVSSTKEKKAKDKLLKVPHDTCGAYRGACAEPIFELLLGILCAVRWSPTWRAEV